MCDILHSVKNEINAIGEEQLDTNNSDVLGAAEPTLLNLPIEVYL